MSLLNIHINPNRFYNKIVRFCFAFWIDERRCYVVDLL